MARGEFIRVADGLVIPNNVTKAGNRMLLAAALANIDTNFWVGLVEAGPDPDLLISDCLEPTQGVGGYERIEIPRSSIGWPQEGTLNGQTWFESLFLEWEPTAAFDQEVQRLMLVGNAGTVLDPDPEDAPVFALSGLMPFSILMDEDTLLADRRFQYRLYA